MGPTQTAMVALAWIQPWLPSYLLLRPPRIPPVEVERAAGTFSFGSPDGAMEYLGGGTGERPCDPAHTTGGLSPGSLEV